MDMDSKYAVMGNNAHSISSKNKFKVKRPSETVKLSKKLKVLNKENGTKESESNVESSTVITNPATILEQRKSLPVYMVRNRLLEEIRKNDVMIVIGETGSGKTTQIPQMIHEMRMEGAGMIGVTQPRRVAAITIAMRVAQEMNTNVGGIVGYTVRFEDATSVRTKVKYLTDGMLLREAMGDRLLLKYSVLVLDEAHERTVSTDVLFGIIKIAQNERIVKKHAPLKIIVMSATMDVDTFSKYFNKCPVIYLEGRTHPVTIFHSKEKLNDYQHATLCTIFQLHKDAPPNHDFLVFLTGQEEIESLMYNIKQIAKETIGPQIRVCALYAGLPPKRQLEAWRSAPPGCRKIVLATNIAETSVTIPNIKYVIDCGNVKERTYNTQTGGERLLVCPCSQAACWQRAGRAGRDAPGKCYRLFTAHDMNSRPAHPVPEILRCPLASTILWMIAIGVEPSTFPLLDSPTPDSIKAALEILRQLGAISSIQDPKLTAIGKKLSIFPIDPKYSKVILSAPDYECLDEVLSIVALLSGENIFHTPMHKREEALIAKVKFISPLGDHITLLNVYKAFCNATLQKQWCRENYMNHRTLSYAHSVRKQLLDLCKRLSLQPSSCGQAYEQVLKCLVTGLFCNTAWVRGDGVMGGGRGSVPVGGGRYMTAAGVAAALHPSSVLHPSFTPGPPPPCLIYSELLTTQRTYMTCVSTIEAEWLYQIAPEFARKCRMAH